MNKIELLYDHYKESNILSQNAQKDRNKLFKYLCLAIFFNLLFLVYPNEIINVFNQFLDNNYSITISITYIIIQSSCWLLITYLLIQYLHKNIYVERQYTYLKILEDEIGNNLNTKVFNRESSNYLNNYPLILNVLDFFYKWILPIAIVLINGIKLYYEYVNHVCSFLKITDTLCFCFIVLLIILYLKMLHFDNKNLNSNNDNRIIVNVNIAINEKH